MRESRQTRGLSGTIGAIATLALVLVGGTSVLQPRSAEPAAGTDAVELDAKKQAYIWDAEHVTFKIETYFGRPLVEGIRHADGSRIAALVRSDLESSVLDPKPATTRTKGILSETRRDASTTGRQSVDAEGLIRYLIGSVAGFDQIDRAGVRVLRIERIDDDPGGWTARLLLTVVGADVAAGPRELEAEYRTTFRFGDESDLTSRPALTVFHVESETLRTSPSRLMEEVTLQAGLADLPIPDNWELEPKDVRQFRFQVAVEDFNRDGYPDIAVGTLIGRPLLLRSVGGKRFENVASSLGIKAPSDSRLLAKHALAAWIDYDNDGFPDLLLGQRLYRNVQGKRFEDVTALSGLEFDRVPLGCAVADYDADGRLDLYFAYQKSSKQLPRGPRPWVGDTESGALNELWRNEGDGRFRNVTAKARAAAGRQQTFAASFFFHDDDRFPDLYVANDFGRNVLLRNRGDGTFEDISDRVAAGDYATSMGVATGDLDNDGTSEISVANMYSKMGRRIIAQVQQSDYPPGVFEQIQGSCAGNRLYTRGATEGRYRELGETLGINEVGWAYAPAMVDLDADGWLDLYSTTGFMSFDREKPDG